MRPATYVLPSLLFLLSSVWLVHAAAVNVTDITVTDVTPHSFSVLWNGDQAAIPSIFVYSDAAGSLEITDQVIITPHPYKGGRSSVREHAGENGVLQVRVSGLNPAVTYHFQTVTIAAASGEVTVEPADPATAFATTQDRSVRSHIPDTEEYLFANDTILIDAPLENGNDADEGTIVALRVAGSAYPVTGIVGDGVTVPFAAMDGANIFDAATHINLVLTGGEEVTLTRFLGINGTETFTAHLLPPRQLAQLRGTVSLREVVRVLQITTAQQVASLDADYDINEDGRIGIEETLYFLKIMDGL